MRRSRTAINLVAVAAASAALLVYAFAELLASSLFNPTYPLYVRLPDSGGLIARQEVTMNGVAIGTVTDVRLDGDGVVAALGVRDEHLIPRDVAVTVLRRSAVGEQAIDLRPQRSGEPFYAPGDTIQPASVTTPVEVQRLLTLADDVFAPVDPAHAAAVVAELADTVRGRREDLRAIIADSADLSAAIAENGQHYDRLFAASRTVNAELAEHRTTLARSIGEMADAAAVLADVREEFDGLLAEAPPVLGDVRGLLDRSQANLSCALRDLGNLNAYLALPEQMANTEEALRLNQFFFVGFDIITPTDPNGSTWHRIQFVFPPGEPPADSYLPAKRPIPDILPGGACTSPFGSGAPAAAQPGWTRTVPEARLIPPGDGGQAGAGDGGRVVGAGTPPVPAGVAATADAPTPTGASAAITVALGVALLGALGVRRRGAGT